MNDSTSTVEPTMVSVDGNKLWMVDGKLHRFAGPAMECANGAQIWYMNGRLHRTDGPAIVGKDGSVSYWLNGKQTDSNFKLLKS